MRAGDLTVERRGLDRTFAILAVVFGLLLSGYSYLRANSPLYIVIGLIVATVGVLWLTYGRAVSTFEFPAWGRIEASPRVSKALAALFFMVFAFSIIAVYLRPSLYERPVIYFALMVLAILLIVVEALVSRGRRWVALILIQTILVGLNLTWSQLFIYEGLVQSDPWYHQALTSTILESGSIPDGFSYSFLPVLHLLIGSTSLIIGSDYKLAMALSAGLAQIVLNVLFVYLITRAITKSPTAGMLAAVVIAISDYNIFMSLISIPSSLAAAFIPAIIFLLLFKKWESPIPVIGCAAVLTLAVVFTHTVAAAFMVLLLAIGFLVRRFPPRTVFSDRPSKFGITGTITAFALFAMLGWWAYGADQFSELSRLLDWGFNLDAISAVSVQISPPWLEHIMTALGMYLLFGIALFGFLYLLAQKKYLTTSIAMMSIAPLVVGLASLMAGIFVNQQRWYYFAQVMLAIPAGMALYMAFNHSKSAWKRAAMVALVVPLAFFLILGPVAASDNHVLTPTVGVRQGFYQSEIVAFQSAIDRSTEIYIDSFYVDSMMSSLARGHDINTTSLDQSLINAQFDQPHGTMILLRDEVVNDNFPVKGGKYKLDYDPELYLYENDFSLVYSSSSVRMYERV